METPLSDWLRELASVDFLKVGVGGPSPSYSATEAMATGVILLFGLLALAGAMVALAMAFAGLR